MAKSIYEQIEKARGKPLREVLKEEFRQHEEIGKVARALGVSQSTASVWLLRCGLQIKQVLVDREEKVS